MELWEPRKLITTLLSEGQVSSPSPSQTLTHQDTVGEHVIAEHRFTGGTFTSKGIEGTSYPPKPFHTYVLFHSNPDTTEELTKNSKRYRNDNYSALSFPGALAAIRVIQERGRYGDPIWKIAFTEQNIGGKNGAQATHELWKHVVKKAIENGVEQIQIHKTQSLFSPKDLRHVGQIATTEGFELKTDEDDRVHELHLPTYGQAYQRDLEEGRAYYAAEEEEYQRKLASGEIKEKKQLTYKQAQKITAEKVDNVLKRMGHPVLEKRESALERAFDIVFWRSDFRGKFVKKLMSRLKKETDPDLRFRVLRNIGNQIRAMRMENDPAIKYVKPTHELFVSMLDTKVPYDERPEGTDEQMHVAATGLASFATKKSIGNLMRLARTAHPYDLNPMSGPYSSAFAQAEEMMRNIEFEQRMKLQPGDPRFAFTFLLSGSMYPKTVMRFYKETMNPKNRTQPREWFEQKLREFKSQEDKFF